MQAKIISLLRSGSFFLLVISLAVSMLACDSSNLNNSNVVNTDCGANSTPASKSSFSVNQGPISQMATGISTDAGRVIAAENGSSNRMVVVFEETHTSRVGQLEIALMLLRLHDKHNLRQISLEGAIAEKGNLSPEWFQKIRDSNDVVQNKERVAVRLLKEGEINSAEFIALLFQDTVVKGNEREDEYKVTMADKSSTAPLGYLFGIAEKSLTKSQIFEANQLMEANKQKEALEFILKADPWVNQRYQKLIDKSSSSSSEELIGLYQEIEAKATAMSVKIDPEMRSGMNEVMEFFKTASKRSCTMVKNTMAMCDASPNSPVALIVGAAHTAKVVELLKANKVSYAVISPNSLVEHSEHGALSLVAYGRKLDEKSVDTPGQLGTFLKNRRKPTTILNKQWFQSKSEIYIATGLIAAAAAGGGDLPSPDLEEKLKELTAINIAPSSYRVIKVGNQNRVVFKVTARTDDKDPSRTVDIWVGGWKEPPGPPNDNPPVPGNFQDPDDKGRVSLEEIIQEAMDEMRKEKEPTKSEIEDVPKDPPVLTISKKIKAVFSSNQDVVLTAVGSI